MRQSKKSGSDLAINDVLRVVSSSAQEDFNATMLAAYGGDGSDDTPAGENVLRENAMKRGPSGTNVECDHLIGADLWMLDSADSAEFPEESHIGDKHAACAALIQHDLFPLTEIGITQLPTDLTSLPVKRINNRPRIAKKKSALEDQECAYFFRVTDVAEPAPVHSPAVGNSNSKNARKSRSAPGRISAVPAPTRPREPMEALNDDPSLAVSIAGHVEDIEQPLVEPRTQGLNDLMKKILGKFNLRSAGAVGS